MSELLKIKNLGPVMVKKLNEIGIYTISDLSCRTPNDLYLSMSIKSNKFEDLQIFDLCSAIIHNSKTGDSLHWSHFSKLRLKRIKKMMWTRYIVNSFTEEEKEQYQIDQLDKEVQEAEFL